jgi:hypothetical protein
MANYTVATNEIGAWEKTLTASTVDTISFAADLDEVEVLNESTTAGLYFTTDGTTPTVGAAAAYYCPPGGVVVAPSYAAGATTVKVISSGTPKYSVSRP